MEKNYEIILLGDSMSGKTSLSNMFHDSIFHEAH